MKLDDESAALLTEIPEERGAGLKMPPSDPLIYRFYEIVQGYGLTLQTPISEEFGATGYPATPGCPSSTQPSTILGSGPKASPGRSSLRM